MGKERDYIIHDENNVKGFFGDYRFLSNFHVADVWYEGILYPSTEHAYQAAKTLNEETRKEFLNLTCSKAKNKGQETVIVCLDNQGAFDCAWPDAIRFQLLNTDIPKDFIRYISNFLDDRSFMVRVCGSFSSLRFAKAGVPQGSSLSPHLYILLVRNIFKKNCNIWLEVHIGHFADDIALWTSDKTRRKAVARMNEALNEVTTWMSKFRQILNTSKSQAMIFTTKGLPKPGSTPLFIKGVVLEWREFVLYLGVRFDRTLSWKPQFEFMIQRFADRMNLLRKLCHKDFGISPKIGLMIYKCYIRPVVEYGCPAFLALQKHQTDKLQILQNQALRLCLRAPRDTEIVKLHEEAKIPLLKPFLMSRFCKFVNTAIENNVLCGEEALYYLSLYSEKELKKSPLGLVYDKIFLE